MQQIYRTTPILKCVISIKLQSDFLEITLRHRCSLVKLLQIFGLPFLKNTSRRLLPSKALTMFKLLSVSSLQFSNSSFGMLYVCLNSNFAVQLAMVTAKNTVISPNYLVQKFFGKGTVSIQQFWANRRNYAENVPFRKISAP